MGALEEYIAGRITEGLRAAGAFWCPLCGHDHLDTTAECRVPVNPPLRGIGPT